MRLYYWIHHTGSYGKGTGVQRVVANVAAALVEAGHELVPVRWCAEREATVHAEEAWAEGLVAAGGPPLAVGPEAGTPLHLAATNAAAREGAWLILPEVPHVAGEDAPNLAVVFDYARYYGLRTAAVFYDLVPLRHPGYETMARAHAQYARSLVGADLVLAISAYSARDLERWWGEHDYESTEVPPVVALLLPEEIRGVERVRVRGDEQPEGLRFVALGTVEPRKNQLEVMRAFVRLRERRPDLELHLDVVGAVHGAVRADVDRLAAGEARIHVHGYLPDDDVHRIVSDSDATVFVSLYEGFGLPVAESLWLGTPCLCSNGGPMREIADGGGCLLVPAAEGAEIEGALERLADDPALRAELAEEACTRELHSWGDYAEGLVGALAHAPAVDRIVLLEGSGSSGEAPSGYAEVRRLRWRRDLGALLPVDGEPGAPWSGVRLRDWAVLPLLSCRDTHEAQEIVAVAHGLGLLVALRHDAGAGTVDAELLAGADLTLFADDASHDRALADGLRRLPKTAGFRGRLEVVSRADTAVAIGRGRPRTTAAGGRVKLERVYYWSGLTAEQPFNTGIQRVTRRLGRALQGRGIDVIPVEWNGRLGRMTPVAGEGLAHLAKWGGPLPPADAHRLPDDLEGEWLLIPEITVPVVPPGSDVAQLARSLGMRSAAIFYDLIPEKMRELYPSGVVDAFRRYWRTFESVELALPISWTAAADLRRYLEDRDMRVPTIVPCPLPGDASGAPRTFDRVESPGAGEPLRLLAVGTWEPRKNHVRMLRALAVAQARAERPIELTLVGRRAGYDSLDREIEALARESRVVVIGEADDATLFRCYDQAHATVFASWEEGFGLPVLESLWHGRPCLCHDGSAMAELAPGGGVLAVDMLDEEAIADALTSLAGDPSLLHRLGAEAATRPLRTWDQYAEDVVHALSRAGSAPGWPLPAVAKARPLLTCAITTYNRAPWLRQSLPRLLEATRPWRDVIEVVVCDNASTDDTPDVLAAVRHEPNVVTYRNRENVGMLGNLAVTARASRGAFVWLLGDDDIVIDGAVENVLEGLAAHPEVEMAYLNYAYTREADPEIRDLERVIAEATPIAPGGPNRLFDQLRDVAGLNENLFTAIYTCVFRRDHALRAYQLDTRGPPFTSLATCVPSAVYALDVLQDRPAWWVGEPAVVVNMNVSWLRWRLLWHLERMPDLFERAEQEGIDPARLDEYRLRHLTNAEEWVRSTYFEAEDVIRTHFSLARLLERCKHLREFREVHLHGIKHVYREAWAADRVVADAIPPDELFARYGLE